MTETQPIRVFVAHSFDESDDYLRVFEYLESVENFYYINCAKPDNVPAGSAEALKEELLAQIKDAEVVLMLATLYEREHDWGKYIIDCAKANSLPVIAIRAFGETVVLGDELSTSADVIVDWNEREIVDAIKSEARGDDANRWETIDFP